MRAFRVLRPTLRSRLRSLRTGISLLEVMTALTILGTTLLGMAEYSRRYARANANWSMKNNALDLASGRVERVKAERNYISMDSMAVRRFGAMALVAPTFVSCASIAA